tara:strand:- start:445 stop:1881 length:1437 start_codon:yes stop_codon:yes gene_type:complete
MQNNKGKILLIYPKIQTVVIQPPLALLTLASYLIENGFEIKIVDRRINKESIKKLIEQEDFVSVGISLMTGSQIKDGLSLCKQIKEIKNIPIIAGGVHPTFMPKQTIQNKYIDFAIKGMAEEGFLELNNKLINNEKDYSKISGLIYKVDNTIKINPENYDNFDIDKLPAPAWNLINVRNYLEKGFIGKHTITMIASRGCPHRCAFCYSKKFFSQKWYSRSVKNVLEELDTLLKKYPEIDSIYFNDDNFAVDKKRMMEICKGLKERGLEYSVFIRANYVTDDLIKYLKENNCIKLGIGAESGSQRVLNLIKKDIKIEDTLRVAKLCRKYNMSCFFSFMVGYPCEKKEDVNKTLDLIDKLIKINPKCEVTDLKILTPYPGTGIYNECIEAGFKAPKTLEEWSEYEWNKCHLPWIKNPGMYETISLAVLLTFYSHRITRRNNPIANSIIKILKVIETARWKNRFWHFGIESKLLKIYLKFL